MNQVVQSQSAALKIFILIILLLFFTDQVVLLND